MAPRPTISRLQILAAAVLFSTGGTVAKMTLLSGWQVAGLRSLVAALTLFVLLPGARGRWSGRSLLVGAIYACALVGFILASKWTTAANAVFLTASSPLYVALLGPWLLKEPIRRRDLIYMMVMAIGLVLCLSDVGVRFDTAPRPALGNVVAVLTAIFWALTVMGLRWLGREGEDVDRQPMAVVSGNLIAFVICLPQALPLPLSMLGPRDLGVILFLGSVQIGLAYVLLTAALRRVPALEASLLMLVDPVLSSLLAWWAHGEVQGRWAMVGAGLILVSAVMRAFQGRTLVAS